MLKEKKNNLFKLCLLVGAFMEWHFGYPTWIWIKANLRYFEWNRSKSLEENSEEQNDSELLDEEDETFNLELSSDSDLSDDE